MASEDVLTLWVIYDSPSDYPGYFVLRPQWAQRDGTIVMSKECWTARRVEGLRLLLPPGLTNIGRQPEDDPVILEVWI